MKVKCIIDYFWPQVINESESESESNFIEIVDMMIDMRYPHEHGFVDLIDNTTLLENKIKLDIFYSGKNFYLTIINNRIKKKITFKKSGKEVYNKIEYYYNREEGTLTVSN